MTKIKIGTIGAGNMGNNHLRVLSKMQEFELVGLHDSDTKRANNLSAIYGVKSFDKMDDLFCAVDAVTIAAPSVLHSEITIAAAKRACNVLVEKPIALRSSDAIPMIEACNNNGVTLMVGHVERFNPVIIELLKVLKHEEIIALHFTRLSSFDSRISDANVVEDLMIHDLDVLNAIVASSVNRVCANGNEVYTDKLDYAQALILFENGILANLTASRVTESKVRDLYIDTKGAYIKASYLDKTLEMSRKTKFKLETGYEAVYQQESVIERVFVPSTEPLQNEFEHFASCITNKTEPITNGVTSMEALILCEKIIADAYESRKV